MRYLQETPVLLNEKPPDIVIDGLLVSLSPPVGIADQVFDCFGLFPILVQLQHPALQQNADGRGALVKKKRFSRVQDVRIRIRQGFGSALI